MKSVRTQLAQLFVDAFTHLGLDGKFASVTVSDRPDLAQFQCNGALAAAKALKRNPREVAQEILTKAQNRSESLFGASQVTFSIAGPGFINMVLSGELLAKLIRGQVGDPRLGFEFVSSPKTVVIDYGGPNVAKGMHVGHLRSSIIGDSLARLHRFVGHQVIGDNHVGDWGTQMGMLICELKARRPQLSYFAADFTGEYPKESPVTLADLEEMYPKASKRYETDEAFKAEVLRATDELQSGRRGYKALWRQFVSVSVADLTRDYAKLGIKFDLWLGESFYEDRMPALVEKLKASGITKLSEGALVIELADEQDPEMPPLILVKSGGGFLYHTSDLATCEYRAHDLKADSVLYVVDNRQTLHFKQVFKALKKTALGLNCEYKHLPFGTMNGPDGKPFKTRAGGVLKLKELIAMINSEARTRLAELKSDRPFSETELEDIAGKVGIATLKFADLKHNRAVDYIFDLEKFAKFEGHTGPYLLYATIRIKSIERKASDLGLKVGEILAPTTVSEKNLILEMMKFPEVLQTAVNENEPHHICEYGFAISQAFNAFYAECHILRETDSARQSSWLSLVRLAHDHLELSLGLLGISIPERM